MEQNKGKKKDLSGPSTSRTPPTATTPSASTCVSTAPFAQSSPAGLLPQLATPTTARPTGLTGLSRAPLMLISTSSPTSTATSSTSSAPSLTADPGVNFTNNFHFSKVLSFFDSN